ncbi:MAG: triose-phosphate isomerase [Candidatus Improbicoccus pseudotrichonymphae]|uniref:Triosephosphate isomerase n=1 Tax=Candidatus Improbicoccus pseudotrichonymphae TaxID=3033792 RepID=A0AA48I2W7_9FIRM|nr:MAG: triose-phosphate isomerase [Candidatus Improbicoccus pseudotrichonymphae]
MILISKIIALNWKMNKNPEETLSFLSQAREFLKNKKVNNKIVISPTFLCLKDAINFVKSKNMDMSIFAQNCHWEDQGAFTGEISAKTLKDINTNGVILGHSERKSLGENEIIFNKKLKSALKFDLEVILCIGETETEYKNNETIDTINWQIKFLLKDIDEKYRERITIAYEPIWSIGTSKTPKIEDIEKISTLIKNATKHIFEEPLKTIYGGSVNTNNFAEILAINKLDGILIGAASLSINNFFKFISFSQQ